MNAACAGHGGTPVTLILSSGWGCCLVFVLFLVSWLLSLFFLAWGLVIRLVARMGCAWHWRRKLRTSLQLTVFGFSQLSKPGTLNYDIWGSRADIFVNGSIIIQQNRRNVKIIQRAGTERQRPRKTTTESSILAERFYHFGVFGKGLERQQPWKTSTEKSILAERG